MKHVIITVAALALLASACGAGEPSIGSTHESSTTIAPPAATQAPPSSVATTLGVTVTTAAPAPSITPVATVAPSTVPPTTTAPEGPSSGSGGLPGEVFDGGPAARASLHVIGVSRGDVLNVRAAPGTDSQIVATLSPDGAAVATGRARRLPASIWFEVTADEVTGWAASPYLAYRGATDDATAEAASLIANTAAADAEELGWMVVRAFFPSEAPPAITVTAGPGAGSLTEVVFDVVGFEDDSVRGVRLAVFAAADEAGFSLHSVERTLLCGRGVTDDGICV